MNKLLKISTITLLCLISFITTLCFVSPAKTTIAISNEYIVAGFEETIDFESESDINKFNIGGELGTQSFINDGRLCIPIWDFQYGAYKAKTYSGDIDVRTHVYTANPTSTFGFGIELRSTAQSTNGVCFYVSRPANSNVAKIEIGSINSDRGATYHKTINGINITGGFDMRVVLKGTMSHVFINDFDAPVVSYDVAGICASSGYVGFRAWQSAIALEYITIIAPENDKPASINDILNNAKAIDKTTLTSSSSALLTNAISKVENASNQETLDVAVAELKAVIKDLVYIRSVSELNALISQASSITNPNGAVYTANSYNSMIAVLELCKNVDTTDVEHVSYLTGCLESKIANLITYIGGTN